MLLLSEWSSQVTTRDGIPLNIRSVSPSDKDNLLAFLREVSADDLRFRFLSGVTPSETLARILTEVDHSSSEDLIAFDGRDGRIAATAMIAESESPESAEIAILVRGDLKGYGLGWAMLSEACKYARERGYRRAECVEFSSHAQAIGVEMEQGFVAAKHPDDAQITILSKDLK